MGFQVWPSASIMGWMASSKDKPWTGLASSSNLRIPEIQLWYMRVLLNYLGGYHYVIMEFETNPNEIKCIQKPYLECQTIRWEETCPGTKNIHQHQMGGKTRTHKRKHCKNHWSFRNSTISLQDYRIQYVWYQILSHRSSLNILWLLSNPILCKKFDLHLQLPGIDFEIKHLTISISLGQIIHLNCPERVLLKIGPSPLTTAPPSFEESFLVGQIIWLLPHRELFLGALACHPRRSNDNQPYGRSCHSQSNTRRRKEFWVTMHN